MNADNSIFNKAAALLDSLNLKIVSEDKSRPWGGFYVIDESQAMQQSFNVEESYFFCLRTIAGDSSFESLCSYRSCELALF